jgi:hypothetical protein
MGQAAIREVELDCIGRHNDLLKKTNGLTRVHLRHTITRFCRGKTLQGEMEIIFGKGTVKVRLPRRT